MTLGDLDPLTTAPVRQPSLGAVGAARWVWRQLTSMRVALLLLFLLAVAAVPGSLFPQRGVAPLRVQDYLVAHPTLGPVLDRLSMFDVYAAPWFAATYLLLMLSLAGCIVPRVRLHWRALRAQPPAAPRNLSRLPAYAARTLGHDRHETHPTHRDDDGVSRTQRADHGPVERAAAGLREQGFRVRVADDGASLGAEKGYVRETGNLVFHVALLVLLVGVAWGGLLGYKGTVVVVEGEGFSNTLSQYDTFVPGRRFDESMLAPFAFHLDTLDATFLRTGPKAGQPSGYSADVTVTPEPGAQPSADRVSVNHPLGVSGAKVYLLGTGYAPVFTVTDGEGHVVYSGPVVTLPQDAAFTSAGVIKVPDASPDQLGFQVRFTPTAPKAVDPLLGPTSTFPEDDDPRVYLGAWKGDLGLDRGQPQNIYQLDTSGLTRVGNRALDVGDRWTLPGGAGSISFDGVAEWGNFQVSSDPGRWLVLAAAVSAIAGVVVSLTVRRRRIWVRATPDGEGRTLVEAAGLARTEDAGLDPEVVQVLAVAVGPATTEEEHR